MNLWIRCSVTLSLMTLLLVVSTQTRTGPKRSSYAGPYIVKFENMSGCSHLYPETQAEITDVYCTDRRASNDCRHATANLKIRQDIDFLVPANCSLQQWKEKQWKKDPVVMKFRDGTRALHDFLPDVYTSALGDNLKPSQGDYVIDAPLKLVLPGVPIFPYGRWRGLCMGHHPQRSTYPVFCMIATVDIVPK